MTDNMNVATNAGHCKTSDQLITPLDAMDGANMVCVMHGTLTSVLHEPKISIRPGLTYPSTEKILRC